nr:MAG TPA: hypothetical protein [Caudoviricetes sp.]
MHSRIPLIIVPSKTICPSFNSNKCNFVIPSLSFLIRCK